jgi:hypothetical protein
MVSIRVSLSLPRSGSTGFTEAPPQRTQVVCDLNNQLTLLESARTR